MHALTDENAANLALIWPRERWKALLSHLVALVDNDKIGHWRTAVGVRIEHEALDEFVDAVSLMELACLCGWAKPRDFPTGFLSLAVSLLSGSRSMAWLVERGQSVLPVMALFRLRADLLVAAGILDRGEVTSSDEMHLRVFDAFLEEIQKLLFDPQIRRSFDHLASGSSFEQLPPNFDRKLQSLLLGSKLDQSTWDEVEITVLSLWRFIEFAGHFSEAIHAWQSSAGCGALAASCLWHLISGWCKIAGRHAILCDRLHDCVRAFSSPKQVSSTTRALILSLHDSSLELRLLKADAGMSLIKNGERLYGGPASEYASKVRTLDWF
jgi:hypothetical protein